MAYKIIDIKMHNSDFKAGRGREIITAVLDSSDDLVTLGTGYCAGSIAMVADKGVPSYMLNASGEWKEI